MHVGTGFNVQRGGANDTAVFEDFLASADWTQCNFVTSRTSIADRKQRVGHTNRGTRFERLERRSNVVAAADHDGKVHDAFRCIHGASSAASGMTMPVV